MEKPYHQVRTRFLMMKSAIRHASVMRLVPVLHNALTKDCGARTNPLHEGAVNSRS